MKTALITGASKGIGFAIAEAMLKENINVVLTSRNASEIKQIASQLNTKYVAKTIGIAANVASFDEMESVAKQALDAFGPVDYVIANAGIGHFANIKDLSPNQWHETINTNLTGVYNTVKTCLLQLIDTQGYIITIASLAGTNFFENGTAYNASKFGLVGFSQALMLDLRPQKIKVTTIMPGSVATYFNNHTPNPTDAWKIQPEDIAQLVMDLIKMPARSLPSKIEIRPSQTK
jgi:3-oxoacyl-[acyl-carrier protein] reductase